MTTPQPRRPYPDDDPAAAVAGLARETEALRRRLDDLGALRGQVAELADVVADLAERLITDKAAPAGPTSWLGLPDHDAGEVAVRRAAAVLVDLVGWTNLVYLRYPDAAASLPECWLWHPDVVEELLWLRTAWAVAYRGPVASALQAGDWHDRCRPGVVRRIRVAAGTCSRESHRASPRPTTACLDAVIQAIAAWWTGDRDGCPPTAEHLADHPGTVGRPS